MLSHTILGGLSQTSGLWISSVFKKITDKRGVLKKDGFFAYKIQCVLLVPVNNQIGKEG